MQKISFIILICLLLIPVGCQRKKEAVGREVVVTVVADPEVYKQVAPALSAALERIIRTPWPEQHFELVQLPPEQLSKIAVRPSIIMIGLLDKNDKTSKQVRAMLPEGMDEQVRAGKSFVFRREDPWAKNQILLVLAGTNADSLIGQIGANEDYLFNVLRRNLLKRTKNQMFSELEQKDIAEDLLEKYGWQVRVQHDYHLWKEYAHDNFVMLRRTAPERWFFVKWIESTDPSIITREWVLKQRYNIGQKYYEKDTIPDTMMTTREVDFNGRWALELQGLWENNEKLAGGPYKSYTFYDEEMQRIYMLDMAVFAPGRSKEELIRQLEVMARTFQTKSDIEKQKKEH